MKTEELEMLTGAKDIDLTYYGKLRTLKNLKPQIMDVDYTVEGKTGKTTTTSILINGDNKDFLMITFNFQELKELVEGKNDK